MEKENADPKKKYISIIQNLAQEHEKTIEAMSKQIFFLRQREEKYYEPRRLRNHQQSENHDEDDISFFKNELRICQQQKDQLVASLAKDKQEYSQTVSFLTTQANSMQIENEQLRIQNHTMKCAIEEALEEIKSLKTDKGSNSFEDSFSRLLVPDRRDDDDQDDTVVVDTTSSDGTVIKSPKDKLIQKLEEENRKLAHQVSELNAQQQYRRNITDDAQVEELQHALQREKELVKSLSDSYNLTLEEKQRHFDSTWKLLQASEERYKKLLSKIK